MKKQITLALSILLGLFSSCSSTYYYTILNSSNENVEKVENGDLLYENDSLWIAYNFHGEDAPIQITVYNKLDKPLFIDWKRSSLILGNQAHSYERSKIDFVGNTEGESYESIWFGGVYKSYGTIQAELQLPKNLSFIPPKTMVVNQTLNLGLRFDQIKDKYFIKAKLGAKQGDLYNIKKLKFEEGKIPPTAFSSYLTFYYNENEPFTNTMDFYLTDLFKVNGLKPTDLPSSMYDKGDIFYQVKRPNNTAWKVIGSTVLVAGAVAIDVMLYDDEY